MKYKGTMANENVTHVKSTKHDTQKPRKPQKLFDECCFEWMGMLKHRHKNMDYKNMKIYHKMILKFGLETFRWC